MHRFYCLVFLSCYLMHCSNPVQDVQIGNNMGIPYNLFSDTSGYQWVKTSWANGRNAYSFVQSHNAWYLGTDSGELLSSIDNGSTWTCKLSLPNVIIRSIDFVNDTILLAAFGLLEVGNQGIYRSIDHEQSFQQVSIPDDNHRPMSIKSRNDTVVAVWSIGWLGNHGEIGCVRSSYDAGQTWQKINNSSGSGFYSILIKNDYLLASTDGIGGNDIYKMKMDGSQLVMAYNEQIYSGTTDFDTLSDTILSTNSGKSLIRSIDEGSSWHPLTEYDSTSWVTGIIAVNGTILLGSDLKGIMLSRDGGSHFMQFNTGFNQGLPKVYTFFQAGNNIYCITKNDGIWRLIRK